jgi:hypothetical protein
MARFGRSCSVGEASQSRQLFFRDERKLRSQTLQSKLSRVNMTNALQRSSSNGKTLSKAKDIHCVTGEQIPSSMCESGDPK